MTEEPITRAERQRSRESGSIADERRMVPASVEAEQGVLCSILLDPEGVMGLCQEKALKAEWFYQARNQALYTVLCCMWLDREPIDIITLTTKLHALGQLDEVGGGSAVSELYTYLPSPANAEHYIGILQEKRTLREIIRVVSAAETKAYHEQHDVAAILDGLHAQITALTLYGAGTEKTFRQIVRETEARWRERKESTQPQIHTGFARLDRVSPIRRKHTVVISGREKSGKSALAGAIVLNVAVKNKLPTLVFSLEMPSEEWVDRLLSEQGSISQQRIHSGALEGEEWDRAAQALQSLDGAPIDVFDNLLGLPQIVAKMRQWKAQHPSGALCVIDYLQLIDVPVVKGRNREQEVALMSKTLRNTGKALDLALIELCQLNSTGEARESRAIQQDCTAFWQVIEELDDKGNVKTGRDQARTVHVRFQRHGERNIRIPFTFCGDWMRFTEEPEPVKDAEMFEEADTRSNGRRGRCPE